MPNQPAQDTVTASFTLPRGLMKIVRARALAEMTTASDIIRRALMNYLSADERATVINQVNYGKIDGQMVGKVEIHFHCPLGGSCKKEG